MTSCSRIKFIFWMILRQFEHFWPDWNLIWMGLVNACLWPVFSKYPCRGPRTGDSPLYPPLAARPGAKTRFSRFPLCRHTWKTFPLNSPWLKPLAKTLPILWNGALEHWVMVITKFKTIESKQIWWESSIYCVQRTAGRKSSNPELLVLNLCFEDVS